MTEEFNPYDGFVGLTLNVVSFTRYGVNFLVSGKIDNEYKSYRLSASSNICFSEDEIFDPKTEQDFSRPHSNIVERLLGFLEQDIVDFKPLKKFRACKLEFSTGTIFVWEHIDDIVDNLFIVTDTSSSKDGIWWLIDDK